MPAARPLDWATSALWQQLEPLLPGVAVEVVPRLASTNTTLLERARRAGGGNRADDWAQATPDGGGGRRRTDHQACVLVAETQTAGRGRQGKTWFSEPGASLTFSLSLPLAPADWSGLSLAVGLALAEVLEPLPPEATPHLKLKWPNDLLWWPGDGPAGGGKLGGILIETVPVGARRIAVIGIGLNVQPFALTEPLPWGQASLQSLRPGITAPQALALVARPLVQAVLAFEQRGFAPCAQAFARRDALLGRSVISSAPQALSGIAEGVDAQGQLWLRCGSQRVAVSSGEVSLAPAGAEPAC